MFRHNRKVWLLAALLVFLAFAAGCDQAGTPSVPQTPPGAAATDSKTPGSAPVAQTMQVTVYFATKDAMYLVPEVRTVAKSDHPAHSAIELLLGGPANPELARVLPEGAKLRSLTVKDHVAYADFSDRLVKGGSGGSAGEILAVSALVNTLTEFPDIHKVQLLVEGKKIVTLYGHLDTSEPMSRSEGIIKK